jgi:hypothetical protein
MNVRVALATCFALLFCQPALADESGRRLYVSPGHHVVGLVSPPCSGQFVINGFRCDGVAPACRSWVPGEHVRLISGSWFGDCVHFLQCVAAQHLPNTVSRSSVVVKVRFTKTALLRGVETRA